MSIRLQHLRDAASFLSTFTGRVGEIAVDLTNNRFIMHDGVTAGGWPAAKLSEVITNTRAGVSDSNYTVLQSDRLIAYTFLSAARTVTLPSASGFPTGTLLIVVDESGTCSASIAITLAVSGSDRIDGYASAVLRAAYGHIALQSDGTSKWTIVSQSNLQSRSKSGAAIEFGVVEEIITCSGASSVSTIQIPNRAIVFAVSALVVTAITGAASYNIDATTNSSGGTGSSSGQFGANLGIAGASTNSGVIGPTAWYAASTIKLTAQGGSFAGGQVRVAIQYMLCGTPQA